ncbi:MAG: LysO family transporter [Cetobacterium sp.]
MLRILLYVFIISCGFLLNKYNLIPLKLKNKTSIFQTVSLFFLLAVMGYKIGSDDKIISSFPTLGFTAFVISILSIVGSILFTKLFFMKKGGKK